MLSHCKRSLTILACGSLILPACAPIPIARNPDSANTTLRSEQRRTVPGVAVDLTFDLPAVRAEARVEDELVSLVTPNGDAEVRALVAKLFQAISKESRTELQPLLGSESTASFSDAESQTAHVAWLRRFSKARYSAFPPTLMYHEEQMEVYRATDTAALEARRYLHFSPAQGEVLVVIPLTSPTVGGERLFGTEMQLLLSPEDGALLIRASYEDLALN